METKDAIHLIEKGIDKSFSQTWADFGCGSGTFTYALANILPAGSSIYGLDTRTQKLQSSNTVEIIFRQANIENENLPLPLLSGILMANSLHYIKNKKSFINHLAKYFENKKKLIVVEYETNTSNQWVPYPINFSGLKELFYNAGYTTVEKLGERISAYGGKMYAALIH